MKSNLIRCWRIIFDLVYFLEDCTKEICERIGVPFANIDGPFNSTHELLNIVEQECLNCLPPMRIPLGREEYNKLFLNCAINDTLPILDSIFEKSGTKEPKKLKQIIYAIIDGFQRDVCGEGGEDRFYYVITILVLKVIEIFSEHLGILCTRRLNSAEHEKNDVSTTTAHLRPDVLVHIDKMALLRGELKSSLNEFDHAASELHTKMKEWHSLVYGDIPFLLGFVVAGWKFQWFAMYPRMSVATLKPLGKFYNLTVVSDCISIFLNSINVFRLLLNLRSKIPPPGHPRVFTTINTSSSAIYFAEDHVVKTINTLQHMGPIEDLIALYEYLKDNPSPYLIQPYTIQSSRYIQETSEFAAGEKKRKVYALKIKLHPLGAQIIPPDLVSLKRAVISVLRGLQHLHAAGWVHRDVRWPNVLVKHPKEARDYMLIDLEYSAKIIDGKAAGCSWYRDPDSMPADYSSQWSIYHDVWMVGHLVEDWEKHNNQQIMEESSSRHDFVKQAEEMTSDAKAMLQHPFITGKRSG